MSEVIDHVFSAYIAAAGRHAEISSDYADDDNAIPWMPPKLPLWSKPLSGLGRRSKSVPRKTRRSVVEYGLLASILPNPINPRKHSRQQIEAIAHSIEAFGFNAPILVDSEKRVVAGHARLEAARLLALQEVPVIRLDHLTEAQAKAYMPADNELTDRSSWDDGKVAIVLARAKRYGDPGVDPILVEDWIADYPDQTANQKTADFAAGRNATPAEWWRSSED